MNSSSVFICKTCRLSGPASNAIRTFATSSSRRIIPPESPAYVDVPDSYQPEAEYRPRIRGVLPVPKELFPPRSSDKPSAEYLNRLIRPQKRALSKNSSKMTADERYKEAMTTVRRTHLRTSLIDLYNRKTRETNFMAARSSRRQAERARLIAQPPRLDESLTNTSVPQTVLPSFKLATRATAKTHATKLANTARQEAERAENRTSALHSLYMNARTFITTETQLAAEIEQVFDHPEEEWGTLQGHGSSIWNRQPPATVQTLLRETVSMHDREQLGGSQAGKMGLALGNLTGQRAGVERFRTDQKRMKRIAEELTGGKM